MDEDRKPPTEVRTADDHPVGQVIERILQDLQTIFHSEVQLAITETKEKARRSMKAGIFLAGAALTGLLAALCMVTTCIVALAIVLPLWLAALIMFVLLATAAGGAYLLGRLALEEVQPVPQKTLETMKDNLDWARNRTA